MKPVIETLELRYVDDCFSNLMHCAGNDSALEGWAYQSEMW